MKVVLFCGGYGMRMRSAEEEVIPKPLQMVGPRPPSWHVMRYYAHYGHKFFILCLGCVKEIAPVSKLSDLGERRLFRSAPRGYRPHAGERRPRRHACTALAGTGRLIGYRHDGFWRPTDTFKEPAELDAGYNRGYRPWMKRDSVEYTGRQHYSFDTGASQFGCRHRSALR